MASHPSIRIRPAPTPEERGRELEEASRRSEREELLDALRTVALCAFWCVVGVAAMSAAVATTDLRWAGIAFWGGLAAGNAGILLTLLGAWRRSLERDG